METLRTPRSWHSALLVPIESHTYPCGNRQRQNNCARTTSTMTTNPPYLTHTRRYRHRYSLSLSVFPSSQRPTQVPPSRQISTRDHSTNSPSKTLLATNNASAAPGSAPALGGFHHPREALLFQASPTPTFGDPRIHTRPQNHCMKLIQQTQHTTKTVGFL